MDIAGLKMLEAALGAKNQVNEALAARLAATEGALERQVRRRLDTVEQAQRIVEKTQEHLEALEQRLQGEVELRHKAEKREGAAIAQAQVLWELLQWESASPAAAAAAAARGGGGGEDRRRDEGRPSLEEIGHNLAEIIQFASQGAGMDELLSPAAARSAQNGGGASGSESINSSEGPEDSPATPPTMRRPSRRQQPAALNGGGPHYDRDPDHQTPLMLERFSELKEEVEAAFSNLERIHKAHSIDLLEATSTSRILETEVSSAVVTMQLAAESIRLDMRTVSDAIQSLEGKLAQVASAAAVATSQGSASLKELEKYVLEQRRSDQAGAPKQQQQQLQKEDDHRNGNADDESAQHNGLSSGIEDLCSALNRFGFHIEKVDNRIQREEDAAAPAKPDPDPDPDPDSCSSPSQRVSTPTADDFREPLPRSHLNSALHPSSELSSTFGPASDEDDYKDDGDYGERRQQQEQEEEEEAAASSGDSSSDQ